MLPHGGFEKVSYLMLTVHAKENWRGGEKNSERVEAGFEQGRINKVWG